MMWLLGVPLAGPLAVVALLGAFVPYIGRALTPAADRRRSLSATGGVSCPHCALCRLVRRRLDRPRSALAESDVGAAPRPAPDPRRGRVAPRLRGRWVQRPRRHPAGARLRSDGGRRRHHGARPRTDRRACRRRRPRRPPVWSRSGSIAWVSGAGDHSSSPRSSSSWPRSRCCSRRSSCRSSWPMILAATLEPAAAALERRGLGRTTAATIVTVGTASRSSPYWSSRWPRSSARWPSSYPRRPPEPRAPAAQAVGIGSFVSAIGGGLLSTVTGAVANIVGIVVVLLLGGVPDVLFHP